MHVFIHDGDDSTCETTAFVGVFEIYDVHACLFLFSLRQSGPFGVSFSFTVLGQAFPKQFCTNKKNNCSQMLTIKRLKDLRCVQARRLEDLISGVVYIF